ncbi:MAG: PSP1 domain-containing protein [Thermoleophilia bacterium]
MPRICSVVFRGGGRVYQFSAGDLELAPGDGVVVDTTRGADFGRVVKGPDEVTADDAPRGLRRVLRKASAADHEAIASHAAAEREAKTTCRRLAAELKLDLKVVESRQAFDGPRLTITFFAEERADVRDLQNRLGDRLGRRVELKQVSARDESRIVGGYGPCGRSLCCATFAGDQEPVSIRMAKDQNLPLNPTKISGCCGRLMCCLKYEHQVYVSFRKRAPKRGAIVRTPAGEGKVTDLLAPVDSVVVDLGEGRSETFKLDELGSAAAASGRNDNG